MIARSGGDCWSEARWCGALERHRLHLITAQNRGDRGEKAFGVCGIVVGDLIRPVARRVVVGTLDGKLLVYERLANGNCGALLYQTVLEGAVRRVATRWSSADLGGSSELVVRGHRQPRHLMRLVAGCCPGCCAAIVPRSPARRAGLLRDDLAAVLDRLGQGLASPERAASLRRLRRGWARREECQLDSGALIHSPWMTPT